MVSTEGLERWEVLSILYGVTHPQGMGILHFIPGELSENEAKSLLKNQNYFDYLQGRIMKVEIPEKNGEFDPRLYDRDNYQGAAQDAINAGRNFKNKREMK